MTQLLALTTLVVRDYDEAVGFFVERLGFNLTKDDDLGGGKRWVVVTPPGSAGGLLLAKAAGAEQAARIGDQTGGRVAFFLHTTDFDGDHARMQPPGCGSWSRRGASPTPRWRCSRICTATAGICCNRPDGVSMGGYGERCDAASPKGE